MRALLALSSVGILAASLMVTPHSHATFRGENGRIVFVGNSPQGRDIFSILPDGTSKRRLTHTGRVQDPRYDATGRRLAFTRVGRTKNVWIMRADGTHETPVITGAASQSQPSWSPDGEWLAFTSNKSGRRQVHLYEFATGERRQLTFASSSLQAAWAPAWSPDGERIAFVARVPGEGPLEEDYLHVLMTVDAAGAEDPVQLTSESYAGRPDWIPNGSRLLFSVNHDSGHDFCPDHAYSIASDGSETSPTRLGTTGCWEFDPVRSPDGQRMALYSTEPDPFFVGADRGLYVARPNGTRQRLIARNVRQELGIDWQRR